MRIACSCPRHRRVSSGRVWQGFSDAAAVRLKHTSCSCCAVLGFLAVLVGEAVMLLGSSEGVAPCRRAPRGLQSDWGTRGSHAVMLSSSSEGRLMVVRSLRCSSESCFVALLPHGVASLRSARHAGSGVQPCPSEGTTNVALLRAEWLLLHGAASLRSARLACGGVQPCPSEGTTNSALLRAVWYSCSMVQRLLAVLVILAVKFN